MPYTPLELANAFIQTGELTDALDALNQQLIASPTDDDSRRLRIETLLRLAGEEQLKAALVDLDQLANLTVDDLYKRSVIHEKLGHLSEALQAITLAAAQEPQNERLLEREIHLLEANQLDEAALALMAKVPATWRWQQWRGDLAVKIEAWATAIESYSEALSHLLNHTEGMVQTWAIGLQARLLLARAGAYFRQPNFDAAEADYLAAKQLIPDDAMIDFQLGLIAWQRGAESEALKLCQAGWEAAKPRLRDEMRRELASNPGQMALAKALQIEQNE